MTGSHEKRPADVPLRFHSLTSAECDPMRNVFCYSGSIYRGVEAEQVETVRSFFDSGLANQFVEAGLMTPSYINDSVLPDYPMAIEHPELVSPNLLTELPPSMRRDVGVALLRVLRSLDRGGFCLHGIDTADFVIDAYGRPKFHNITAIQPKDSQKIPYADFHANFLGPLRLIEQRPELAAMVIRAGTLSTDEDISLRRPRIRSALRWVSQKGNLGHKLFSIYHRILVLSPFGGLLHNGMYGVFAQSLIRELVQSKGHGQSSSNSWTGALLAKVEKRLISMKFGRVVQKWSNYHSNANLPAAMNSGDEWAQHYDGDREKAIIGILSKATTGTLLDVGANNGHFSILGAKLGFKTTALDYDIGAIDNLYQLICNSDFRPTIRPLLFNFVDLDPAHLERYRSDAVLALGFVHHMRLVELLPWPIIAEKLSGLTGQILVTEFKPGTGASRSISVNTHGLSNDYKLENLVSALKLYFRNVEVVGDFTAIGSTSPRTMIVCRR